MAGRNSDSVVNQGEFRPRRPRPDPHEHSKHGVHKPGLRTSPYDSIPTSHAHTVSPGSAPPESTYPPHTDLNLLPADDTSPGPLVDPLSFPGATSADVHAGLGAPLYGETSVEMRHDGQHGRKREKLGLTRHAMNVSTPGGAELKGVNPRTDERQRALDNEEAAKHIPRGDKGQRLAEDLPPETA